MAEKLVENDTIVRTHKENFCPGAFQCIVCKQKVSYTQDSYMAACCGTGVSSLPYNMEWHYKVPSMWKRVRIIQNWG